MTRFTVDRSVIRAEVERRQAAVPQPVQVPTPVSPPSMAQRWSARVFLVPAVVAEALARLAARTSHVVEVAERRTSHRQRGVYIWRSAEAANMEAELPDADLLAMPDVSTAELEIAKLRGTPLH
jgi:hypothetical protein